MRRTAAPLASFTHSAAVTMASSLAPSCPAGLLRGIFSVGDLRQRCGSLEARRVSLGRRHSSGVPKAALARQEKASLMKGVSSQHSLAVAKVLDQVASASRSFSVCHSDFLTPACQEEVLRVLARVPGIQAVLSGGWEEAERCRVSLGLPESMEALVFSGEEAEDRQGVSGGAGDSSSLESRVGVPGAVAVCKVQGNFRAGAGPKVNHSDFLGAVLGTGITREKVGDILLLEEAGEGEGEATAGKDLVLKGAHVILAPEMESYVLTSLTRVHTVDVQVSAVPLSDIQVRPQRVSQLRTVEASLRLDAVGSAGFRISRSKFVDLLSAGKVRLNWRDDVKGGSQVNSGDVISVRGMGRCKVGDIETTKKGRFAVELTRYG